MTDCLCDVDDGHFIGFLCFGVFLLDLRLYERPYAVDVDRRPVELLTRLVEVAHTDFTEVTRVILVEVDAVMMLTTGITATTRMLTMLTDTTVTGAHVTALTAILLQTSDLR